jgi:methionyl-tRNA formyltransferase
MSSGGRLALLSTFDSPLLGYLMRDLTAEGVSISAVIFDQKGQAVRDHRIHEERTAGRLPPLPLEEFESLRIPFYFVADHRSRATADLVRSLSLDLLLNAGTPRILGAELLRAPSIGVLNCHPGLLPRFRGCTCVEWAIYLDEQVGNTVHFMNEHIDEGPILLQEGLRFGREDAYVDVRVKVYEHGNRLLARAARKVLTEGILPDRLEPQVGGRYFEVIDDGKMKNVIDKLARGDYAFQRALDGRRAE